jgi:hypothetical protein
VQIYANRLNAHSVPRSDDRLPELKFRPKISSVRLCIEERRTRDRPDIEKLQSTHATSVIYREGKEAWQMHRPYCKPIGRGTPYEVWHAAFL